MIVRRTLATALVHAGRSRISTRNRILGIAFGLLWVGGCGEAVAPPETHSTFSFEQGLDGWAPDADACEVPPGILCAPWTIERTADLAYEGQHALKFYMDNVIDGAVIWIVRPFPVTPGRSYEVDVSYAFATRDWGEVNLFVLFTGVFRAPPTDLHVGTVQEPTGNGASSDVGYRWLRKRFHAAVSGDASGVLYVVVGVWGTWETPRTYFVDDLTVQLTPD